MPIFSAGAESGRYMIERMFDSWRSDPDYPTLFRVDRPVAVFASEALPSHGRRRADELPLRVKSGGLRIEAHMLARQLAWIRRSDGGWLCHVLLPAASGNRKSSLTLPLWVDPKFITTDLSVVAPYEHPPLIEPTMPRQRGR